MHVILEHRSGYRLGHEEKVIEQWLLLCGQTYKIAALSQLQRQRIDVKNAGLVVGSLPFIKAALRQHGLEMPVDDTYPSILSDLLGRRVCKLPLHRVLDEVGRGGACFVKPADRPKLFTGYVLRPGDDYPIAHVPRREMVWRSDIVKWISEWRFYVVGGQVAAKACYSGDPLVVPSAEAVSEALSRLNAAGYTAHHAIDFGVLEDGSTALVECNEGFSVGAYEGVSAEIYFKMLSGRWAELMSERKESDHDQKHPCQ